MITLPRFVELKPRRYVAVRLDVTIPFDSEVDPAFDELWDAFAKAGAEPDGTEFMKYNVVDMPRLQIEVGMTTQARIPISGRLVQGELPAGTFVTTTYTGSYDGLLDATAMLIGWAKERGVEWDANPTVEGEMFACRLEVHENNPSIEPDPAKLVTTIMIKTAAT